MFGQIQSGRLSTSDKIGGKWPTIKLETTARVPQKVDTGITAPAAGAAGAADWTPPLNK
jgi:hypothetical protein